MNQSTNIGQHQGFKNEQNSSKLKVLQNNCVLGSLGFIFRVCYITCCFISIDHLSNTISQQLRGTNFMQVL